MTGLIVQQPQARSLQLVTMQDYAAFGRMAAGSKFVPKDFMGRPEDCALAAQYGAEIGLGPMQSLQSIAVVNGRPTLWGDVALALVRSSPACGGVVEGIEGEGEQRRGFCEVIRKGEPPQRRTFSVADAKRAKLWGKTGPWSDYCDRMLQLRARGFALRDVFPDVLRGLVTAEEAQDYRQAEPVAVRPVFPAAAPEAAPQAQPEDGQTWEAFKAESEDTGKRLVMRARKAIAEAASLEGLDEVRQKIAARGEVGELTAPEVAGLVTLCHKRAEELIRLEEAAADATDRMQGEEAAAEARS